MNVGIENIIGRVVLVVEDEAQTKSVFAGRLLYWKNRAVHLHDARELSDDFALRYFLFEKFSSECGGPLLTLAGLTSDKAVRRCGERTTLVPFLKNLLEDLVLLNVAKIVPVKDPTIFGY